MKRTLPSRDEAVPRGSTLVILDKNPFYSIAPGFQTDHRIDTINCTRSFETRQSFLLNKRI